LHIQTVNSRHERLKTFLRRHRGVATKYLDSYLIPTAVPVDSNVSCADVARLNHCP